MAPHPQVVAAISPERVQAWKAALPLGDPARTARELLALLQPANRTRMGPARRLALLAALHPVLADVLQPLASRYARAPLPLSARAEEAAQLVACLLEETACGYKRALLDLAEEPPQEEGHLDRLVQALYHATDTLGLRLLQAYTLYREPPAGVWGELHRLYRYAEAQGLQGRAVPRLEGGGARSVDHAYRRALLLALSRPYHLMQGEPQQLYGELDRWAAACRLYPATGAGVPKGAFYVDLEGEEPPAYALQGGPAGPGVRLLEVGAAVALVEERLEEVQQAYRNESGQLSLAGRRLRDMLQRVAKAWALRPERLAVRCVHPGEVELVTGLRACHHFASGQAPFFPEESEIQLQHRNREEQGGLSLVPEDATPWLAEQEQQRIRSGVVRPRTSQFATGDLQDDKDIWIKVYSSGYEEARKRREGEDLRFAAVACRREDQGSGGLGLRCPAAPGLQLRVGELVAYRERGGAEWHIGCVRWLQASPGQGEEGLRLGIQTLAEDALAVATRGLKGVGQGGEYLRALVVPRLDPAQYPTTLITPTAVYDIDSVVLLNTGEQLLYARLTKLLDATDAFCRYQYQLVEAPRREEEDPRKQDRLARYYR
ncbi:MAG: hypothetical protein D6809_02545 [Gammaproteobacteria bacterium]|nr:MAG: hypothetical protein D6809_02545 [Gammaproteobacteria bacterium]